MNEKIALIVNQWGTFSVNHIDPGGQQAVIADDESLEECLRRAAVKLGYPLVIPISGPTTQF